MASSSMNPMEMDESVNSLFSASPISNVDQTAPTASLSTIPRDLVAIGSMDPAGTGGHTSEALNTTAVNEFPNPQPGEEYGRLLRIHLDPDEMITKILLPKLRGIPTVWSSYIKHMTNEELAQFVLAHPNGFNDPSGHFRENTVTIYLTRSSEESLTHLFSKHMWTGILEEPQKVFKLSTQRRILGFTQKLTLKNEGIHTGYTLEEFFVKFDRTKIVARLEFSPRDAEYVFI